MTITRRHMAVAGSYAPNPSSFMVAGARNHLQSDDLEVQPTTTSLI
jgi:hypothetical protein